MMVVSVVVTVLRPVVTSFPEATRLSVVVVRLVRMLITMLYPRENTHNGKDFKWVGSWGVACLEKPD